MDFTKEQERAVKERGKDLLISAGAGAGKTRVLVSRIADRIQDEKDPVSISEFLVMTFTNAAAREMKERIEDELLCRLEDAPDNRYLRTQLRMVKYADISTVHSFCNRLLRQHFQELELDPSFRIGEEGELFLLRHQALEDVLEEAYASGRESFINLAESYSPGRDDRELEEIIDSLYRFSRGFPEAGQWFDMVISQIRQMSYLGGTEDSIVVKQMFQKAKREITALHNEVKKSMESFPEEKEPARWYHVLEEDEKILEQLEKTNGYENLFHQMENNTLPSCPRANKEEKQWPERLELVKETHNAVRDGLKKIKEMCFSGDNETLCQECRILLPVMEELARLVGRYEEKYFQNKKEKNVYDFDDLEHMALKLLVSGYDETGEPIPSETAKALSRKYKEVFLDEYQDTNLVQETMIKVLNAKEGSRLFAVGDVKQSIYRFRQARPDLFLDRYEEYKASGSSGICIELRDNFRSAPGVLAFCNDIFSRLMEHDFGGVDYNEKIALYPGKGGPMAQCADKSEVMLFVAEKEEGMLRADTLKAETLMIAKRIKELHKEGYENRDIVILLRSASGYGQVMAEYLNNAGILARCDIHTGYFHNREVELALNYLAIVDNVYQDIPMASVMLSSIGGFTEEELARLKTLVLPPVRKEYSLYELIKLYMEDGEDREFINRLSDFVGLLGYFRKKKKTTSLHELLWEIYRKTGLFYDVMLMPEGEKRRENLLMLLQKAEEYEKTVFKGLFYFLRYMDQLRSYEVEMGEASVNEDEENTVRIMTIHKSIGLEFPVVFVSDLSKKFNLKDARAAIVCHPEMGIGLNCVDMQRRISVPSLMKKAITEMMCKDTLEEELRILYVAMTRAKNKLILTAGVREEALFGCEKVNLNLVTKLRANSVMDWLLPIFSMHKNWSKFAGTASSSTGSLESFELKMIHSYELPDWTAEEKNEKTKMTLEEAAEMLGQIGDMSAIYQSFDYRYPHMDSVSWKRKYSVSELKKFSMKTIVTENGREDMSTDAPIPLTKNEELPLPGFLKEEEKELFGADRGTIIHKIMELMPFGLVNNKKELKEILTKTIESNGAAKKISPGFVYRGVEHFLFSEIGEKVRKMDAEGRFYREIPFTIGLPVSFVDESTLSEEKVVIQGIIDAYGEDEEGLWLFDYKTDYVRPGQEQLLLDRYRKQMLYYKTALEQLLEQKVVHTYIYSFTLEKYIEVL